MLQKITRCQMLHGYRMARKRHFCLMPSIDLKNFSKNYSPMMLQCFHRNHSIVVSSMEKELLFAIGTQNSSRYYSSTAGIELISYVAPQPIYDLIQIKYLEGKTVLITGSTRGIGLSVAKKMAEAGANVIITGKSVQEQENLPGTIYTAADEVRKLALLEKQRIVPIPLDITSDTQIQELGNEIEKQFGTIDICIHNAGALWWKSIGETPLKRLDLVLNVNFRGTFAITQMLISRGLMKEGHFIMMSPPTDTWREFTAGKAGYAVSKLGMSMLAYAITEEYPKQFAAFSIWPKTLIESFATKNFKIGDKSQWRKPDILADACLLMAAEPIGTSELAGKSWIDEEFLRNRGVNDFRVYRCDPESEPAPMDFTSITRGKVDEI